MITLICSGDYSLIQTIKRGKYLIIGKEKYVWINPKNTGELFRIPYRKVSTDITLSLGKYRYYYLENEQDLSDGYHLELAVGKRQWQAYLIPDGLPNAANKVKPIVPTHELISGEHTLWPSYDLTNSLKSQDHLKYTGKQLLKGPTT